MTHHRIPLWIDLRHVPWADDSARIKDDEPVRQRVRPFGGQVKERFDRRRPAALLALTGLYDPPNDCHPADHRAFTLEAGH